MHIKLPIEARGTTNTPHNLYNKREQQQPQQQQQPGECQNVGLPKLQGQQQRKRRESGGGGEKEGPRWGDTNENTCHVLGVLFCLPKSFSQLEMAQALPVPLTCTPETDFVRDLRH